jgi:HK97 family phage portal protein
MSLFSRLIDRRSMEGSNLSNPAAWLNRWLGGTPTASGVQVGVTRSLRVVAVYACVRILAETLGSLPLHLYRRLPGGGKEEATDHPLYSLMHDAPNTEMTSMEFRETGMGHAALRGRSYAQIVFGNDGRPVELIPIHPDRIRVGRERTTRRLVYPYDPPDGGARRVFDAEEILHVRGLGSDGLEGYSPITLAREALGLTIAMEEHGARFFANSATPTGIIEHPGVLGEDAYKRLRDSFAEKYEGLRNSSKPILLEEGVKWQAIGIDHENAQFLESRKFQLSEIARLFRVPPHMIADLDKATFSNIEQQSLEFVIHTMLPWLVRHEQRYNARLLLPSERQEYFFELNIDGLLRGDLKSRYEAFQIGRQNGWLSTNDIREMENQNPVPGGDDYVMQMQFVPLDQLGAVTQSKAAPVRDATPARDLRSILLPSLNAACARAVRKETKALAALGKRGLPASELAQFYAEHRRYLADTIGPAFEGAGCAGAMPAFVAEICTESERLADAARSDPSALTNLLTHWETSRAADIGKRAADLLPN